MMALPGSSLSLDTSPPCCASPDPPSSTHFLTLPPRSTTAATTGSLKKVKFVDQNVTESFERHSLPRSQKDKMHLCPMHKHKLSGPAAKALATVAEATCSDDGELAVPPTEWSENKVPPKSYKDIEFNL